MSQKYSSGIDRGTLIDWNNPSRIIYGNGKFEEDLPGIISGYNPHNVLVVVDEIVYKTKTGELLQDVMKKSGANWKPYFIPPKEPDEEMAENITAEARKLKPDLIVAIGGGSTIDMAKLMSIMVTNTGRPVDYAALMPDPYSDKVKNDSVPKILVPTTAGTGSETSNTLVFTHETHKTWITSTKVLANIALIDPELTVSMPPVVTRNTGMDALSHLIEGVISSLANPISDGMIYEGSSLVASNLVLAYNNGNNMDARSNMSLAAMMGGWVIAFPWVAGPSTIGHCMSEGLSPIFGLAHGAAGTIMLPHAIDYNLPLILSRMPKLAMSLGSDYEGDSVEAGWNVISRIVSLAKQLDMPYALKYATKKSKDDFLGYIDYILKDRQYLYNLPLYNPRRLTPENLAELFEDVWEGKFSTVTKMKEGQ
jgi:alcohol dehydrogenase class IV